MTRSKRTAAAAAFALVVTASVLVLTSGAASWNSSDLTLSDVTTANTKSVGYAPASKLSPEVRQTAVAQGSTKVENPSAAIGYYGYDNDVLNAAGQPQMVPTPGVTTEAHKTEPDKNVYLVFKHGLDGADPSYDYGTHFLFQGHEGGTPGYITRVNLDADAAHKVTLFPTSDNNNVPLSTIDGVTWDPFARKLVYTTENSSAASIYAAGPELPTTVEDLSGTFGHAGYEGIQNDSDGNLWIAEDVSGANKPGTVAKIPNSFLYRYVPKHKGDLHNGKLQVLQVLNAAGDPITAASQTPVNSPDQLALHTYGSSFRTNWITIHDTAVDGTAVFDANALAKAKNGTPFKRPENGVFKPESGFRTFFFDETGDTNATSVENDTAGGWTSVWKLHQKDPSADHGRITIFYKGDQAHAGFDNVTFLSKHQISFVEDAGDTLHTQRNALDSGYVLDVRKDYSKPQNKPIRWIAEGRDASATIDSANGGFGKNDQDNELTGIFVSDGDPGVHGILGTEAPQLFDHGWRWFYTQQHGDNPTYEVISSNN